MQKHFLSDEALYRGNQRKTVIAHYIVLLMVIPQNTLHPFSKKKKGRYFFIQMNEGPSCIFRSKRKYPLSGCCNQFCLFSQVLAFLWWSQGGAGLLVRGRFFRKSVQKRSARMGLLRLQRGPGWERE